MSRKWVAIGGAAFVAVLSVTLLFLFWIGSILSLTSDAPTTTPVVVSPQPSAPALSAIVDPRLSSASACAGQTQHPMTRGIGRAMRATITSELGAGLSDLKSQLEKCPDQHIHRGGEEGATQDLATMIEVVRRQLAGGEHKEGARPTPTPTPTVLTLEVETFNSQVKIVDAAPAMPGWATDAFMACARQVLCGRIITVPDAAPGGYLRIAFDLDREEIGGQLQRHSKRRHR